MSLLKNKHLRSFLQGTAAMIEQFNIHNIERIQQLQSYTFVDESAKEIYEELQVTEISTILSLIEALCTKTIIDPFTNPHLNLFSNHYLI
jgi:hypothetical protein